MPMPLRRAIRTVKERLRACYHTLPFKRIPRAMIVEMVTVTALMLTVYPAKEGISEIYPPRQIITGRTLGMSDLKYQFGSFCLAHKEPPKNRKNTMEPRALETIYMRPILDNTQGGHYVYDLHTHKIISCQRVTVLPMTPTAIAALEQQAAKQGIKELRFHNRAKVEFLPAGLPAGVSGDQGNETLLHQVFHDEEGQEDDQASTASDQESTASDTFEDQEYDSDLENEDVDDELHGVIKFEIENPEDPGQTPLPNDANPAESSHRSNPGRARANAT